MVRIHVGQPILLRKTSDSPSLTRFGHCRLFDLLFVTKVFNSAYLFQAMSEQTNWS